MLSGVIVSTCIILHFLLSIILIFPTVCTLKKKNKFKINWFVRKCQNKVTPYSYTHLQSLLWLSISCHYLIMYNYKDEFCWVFIRKGWERNYY
jgi:hypothetical protein